VTRCFKLLKQTPGYIIIHCIALCFFLLPDFSIDYRSVAYFPVWEMILLHKCLELFIKASELWTEAQFVFLRFVTVMFPEQTSLHKYAFVYIIHVPECTSSYAHWSSRSKHAKSQLIMGYVNVGIFLMEFFKTLDLILLCWNLLIRKTPKKLWQIDEGPLLCIESFNCHAIDMERAFSEFLTSTRNQSADEKNPTNNQLF
jgi:hypothetical protein